MDRDTKIDWSNADAQLHAGRQRCLNSRQLAPNRGGHLRDVGLGLPDHPDGDRRRSLESQRAPLVFGPQLDPAEVLELDEDAPAIGHDEIGELFRCLELAEGANGELASLGLDAARRDLDVARTDGLLHVLYGEPSRRQLGGGEPDPHGEAPLSEDPGLSHAWQCLQPALDQPVADIGKLKEIVVLSGEREPVEGLRVGFLFGHDRLTHILR